MSMKIKFIPELAIQNYRNKWIKSQLGEFSPIHKYFKLPDTVRGKRRFGEQHKKVSSTIIRLSDFPWYDDNC